MTASEVLQAVCQEVLALRGCSLYVPSMPRFELPRCRFCRRPWQPEEGVSARASYCRVCADDRRAIAADVLDWSGPIASAGGYLLPSGRR